MTPIWEDYSHTTKYYILGHRVVGAVVRQIINWRVSFYGLKFSVPADDFKETIINNESEAKAWVENLYQLAILKNL